MIARRAVVALGTALFLATVGLVAAHALASSPRWTAEPQLFGEEHGRWVPTSTLMSMDMLRGVVAFHANDATWGDAQGVMEIQHVTWQISHRIVEPATVRVRMSRRVVSRHTIDFSVTVRLPVTLPTNYSIVTFTVTSAAGTAHAKTGLTILPPQAPSSSVPTLSVPQAFVFCSQRPKLLSLPYGLDLRGYYVSPPTSSDGPPTGILLDRVWPVWRAVQLVGLSNHAVRTGGWGPRSGTWITAAGELECSNRRAAGFEIRGAWPLR